MTTTTSATTSSRRSELNSRFAWLATLSHERRNQEIDRLVRADLAMLAGDTARACALWMTAAGARLSRGQGADDEAVIGLVDRAHHCWVRITDVSAAQNLSADLLRLREAVPGRRPGALEQLRRRVADLQGQRGVSSAQ